MEREVEKEKSASTELDVIGRLIDHNEKWINTIHTLKSSVGEAHFRIDALESTSSSQKDALDRVERRLEKAEDQREKFNDYMASEVKELKDTVAKLSDSDNERHEELVGHISTLTSHVDKLAKVTAENSNYISETEATKRQEAYAKEKVEEALAPKKKLKQHIIMTAAGVVTVFVLGVLGKLGWMAINLDELVTNAKKTEIIQHK